MLFSVLGDFFQSSVYIFGLYERLFERRRLRVESVCVFSLIGEKCTNRSGLSITDFFVIPFSSKKQKEKGQGSSDEDATTKAARLGFFVNVKVVFEGKLDKATMKICWKMGRCRQDRNPLEETMSSALTFVDDRFTRTDPHFDFHKSVIRSCIFLPLGEAAG